MRRLARAILIVVTAYFVLWACAPPSTLPPPVPFAKGERLEAGLAAGPGVLMGSELMLDGQLWMSHRLSRERILSWSIQGNTTYPYVGAGAMFRGRFNQPTSRFYIGGQVGAGWLYAQLGLPMGYSLAERVTLFSTPTVETFPTRGILRLPLGVDVKIAERWHVQTEANLFTLGYLDIREPATFNLLFGVSRRF